MTETMLGDGKTLQSTSISGNMDVCGGAKQNPVLTGVSANKHGDSGQNKMVPRGGIEPPTRGFSVRCSTN